MEDTLLSVVVSAITAVAAAAVTYVLSARREQVMERRREADRVTRSYLQPLRLALVEVYNRLLQVQTRVAEGNVESLQVVGCPEDLEGKDNHWFVWQGAYLISSCYLVSSLLYEATRTRDELSYLRLAKQEDTRLVTLLHGLAVVLAGPGGIIYALQLSIGRDLYMKDEERLLTYREYCALLRVPDRRIWHDRLLALMLGFGRGEETGRVQALLDVMRDLSRFLDSVVAGGDSLAERVRVDEARRQF